MMDPNTIHAFNEIHRNLSEADENLRIAGRNLNIAIFFVQVAVAAAALRLILRIALWVRGKRTKGN